MRGGFFSAGRAKRVVSEPARLAEKENDASLNFAGSRASSNRNLPQIPSVSRETRSRKRQNFISFTRARVIVRTFVRYEKKNEKEKGKKNKIGKKIKRWRSEETTGKGRSFGVVVHRRTSG